MGVSSRPPRPARSYCASAVERSRRLTALPSHHQRVQGFDWLVTRGHASAADVCAPRAAPPRRVPCAETPDGASRCTASNSEARARALGCGFGFVTFPTLLLACYFLTPTPTMFGRGGRCMPAPTKKLVCGGWL